MLNAPTTNEIKEKLISAEEDELQQIIEASQNLLNYYVNLIELAGAELESRNPDRPVQLELF